MDLFFAELKFIEIHKARKVSCRRRIIMYSVNFSLKFIPNREFLGEKTPKLGAHLRIPPGGISFPAGFLSRPVHTIQFLKPIIPQIQRS